MINEKKELILLVNKEDQEIAIYKNVKFNQFKAFKVF